MDVLFFHIANVILPILICVGAGYGLARIAVPFDNKTISALVTNIGYPTLIISHLSGAHIALGAFVEMLALATLALACFGIISFVFLKIMGLEIRAFLSPMMHNNVGNIGLPVAMLAFGDAGLAYAMAFVIVVLVSTFTIGMWVPMGRFSIRQLFTSPIIYAVVFTLILMATKTELPKPIAQSFKILGGLSIPLMLLTLGHTLATLRINTLWRATYLSLFHVAMAVTVAFGIVHLFGITGTQRGVFILGCLMPVSVATYLFVDRHVHELAHEVAGFILISTLLTVPVLTLALSFWV